MHTCAINVWCCGGMRVREHIGVLSFHLDSGDLTQVTSLGSKLIYVWSHLTNP